MDPTQAPLSPTSRTTLGRHAERGLGDRQALYDVLDEALICHLGVLVDGSPLVVPTSFGYDLEGPDEGGSLYLHGSVASQTLTNGEAAEICVTVTLVDGIVVARSGFHHSMNYRSAVVRGRARRVVDEAERRHALDIIVDHAIPGRSATLRPHKRKELAATGVIAVPLHEASVKARTGGPSDDEDDVAAGGWAGVLSLRIGATDVEPEPLSEGQPLPEDVRAWMVDFA